ncbi:MAG: ornithine cyclodeaminase family protein [Candidatus Acidiferrales bacterium]
MKSSAKGVLLLTRRDVAALLTPDAAIAAVEQAFRLHAEGRTLPPGVLSIPATDGGFHLKAAGLRLRRSYFAVKCNANFPLNRRRHGLPTIQGLVLLADAENGRPLAVLDSMEITALRTAAATAVAAKYLARPDSRRLFLAGCGLQGLYHLRALARVLPLQQVTLFDSDAAQARRLARQLAGKLRLKPRVANDLSAARACDVIVTCTPSRRAFLGSAHVAPGTFLAAVGADAPEKQELDPRLLAASAVVVDSLEQCAAFGELHHAVAAGLLRREDVRSELADVIVGRKPGRRAPEETIIFDSTGTALEDVAAAVAVYEAAVRKRRGRRINFAA